MFTGQVPFPETSPLMVAKEIVDGERPSRPPGTMELGLSSEIWEVISSFWAHEAGDRPPLSTLVDLLEKVNPDIALLEELMESGVSSKPFTTKFRHLLYLEDHTLFGMREYESLALIEVFDRVGFTILPGVPLPLV